MHAYLSLFLLLCACSGVVSSLVTHRESSRYNIRQGKLNRGFTSSSNSQQITFLPIKDKSATNNNYRTLYSASHSKTSLRSIESVLDLRAGSFSPFLTNDAALTVSLVIEVFIWLKLWTTLAGKGVLPSTLTRKIIHSGSAPLFMMHWPLYADTSFAPFVASIIPLLQILRYLPVFSLEFHYCELFLDYHTGYTPLVRKYPQINKLQQSSLQLFHAQDATKRLLVDR